MHAPSGFVGIFDVSHFIKTLKYDVRLVMSIPEITPNGKTKKLKAHQEFNLDAEIQVNFAVGLAGMKSVANRRCLKFGELKCMGTEAQTGQGTI